MELHCSLMRRFLMNPLLLRWHVSLCFFVFTAFAASADFHPEERFRRPIALSWTDEGLLAVANRDSGSVSLVDVDRRKILSETVFGKKLTDLASYGNGRFLLVSDEEKSHLILLEAKGSSLVERDRLEVEHSPVDLAIHPDGRYVLVSSLWARRSSLVSIDVDRAKLMLKQVADLPFPPRRQWISKAEDRLVVADAFADQLAVLSLPDLQLLGRRVLPGHNVGGLFLAPNKKELLVSHQILNPHVPTTRSRVFWGNLMENCITAFELEDLLHPSSDSSSFSRWKRYPVGENGKGAGEPGTMVQGKSGIFAIAIRGTGEIAMSDALGGEWRRVNAGRRLVDVILHKDGRRAFFADVYGEAIRVVDLEKHELLGSISMGPTTKPGLLHRGEALFHDSRVSLDGWFSCNSCHTGGHTSGRLNDNFDDHSFGTPKRVPSLLGTAETGPWTWNGLQGSLTTQVRQTLSTTLLNGERKSGRLSREDEEALVSFLFTLPIPPPLAEARREKLSPDFSKGKLLFGKVGCNECHRNTLLTSSDEYDVGLVDEAGNRYFNPPSLLGVSQRDLFFHDASAGSIREVLDDAGHPDGGGLTKGQLRLLETYLRAL